MQKKEEAYRCSCIRKTKEQLIRENYIKTDNKKIKYIFYLH
jgi:hypothetical protein